MHPSKPWRGWWIGAVCALVATSASATPIPISNGGFESGNLSGWNTPNPGYVSVVGSFAPSTLGPGTPALFNPVGGTKFALLQSGVADADYTLLTQHFVAKAGDVLSFNVF